MASKYPEEERSSMFECAICLQEMLNRTPKALPCLHTFCMECIQGLPSNENKITCPTCRKECDLSIKGVDGLPDNFHLQSLVHNILQSTKFKTCFGCSTIEKLSEIRNKCLECELEMCDSCTDIHEMKLKGRHEIVRLQVSQPDNVACKEHKSGNVKCYCEDCQELACPVCVLHGSHSTHNTVAIKDIIANVKDDMPKFMQDIEDKVDHLNTVADEIKENLKKTVNAKEEIKTAARLQRKEIDEQELLLLQNCTESEEALEEARTVVEELLSFLHDIKDESKYKFDTSDFNEIMNKIAEFNKQRNRNKKLILGTPTFLAHHNVDLGNYFFTRFSHELLPLYIGMVQRFHKQREITIEDDVPLHISALEDGGVIYAGNKYCKQINGFGKVKMTYEGIGSKNIYCLATKGDELFVFYNNWDQKDKKRKISSGAVTKQLPSPHWLTNDVVILSSDEYINLRQTKGTVFKNGKSKFVSFLWNPTSITSYQGDNGLIILIAVDGGTKVHSCDMRGDAVNTFSYSNGSIKRMCCKDANCLFVLNDKNQIQQIDTTDGRVVVENVLSPEMNEKITTFSYNHQHMWVAVENKLIKYLYHEKNPECTQRQ